MERPAAMSAAVPAEVDLPPAPTLLPLVNTVRPYAWGSSTHIPRFLGLPATDEPAAELWMGAHPADPSRLSDGSSLLSAIQADPTGMVGAEVHERFGARLPFLMKVLAAAEPLSLQVHPSMQRAVAGFEAENVAGIPLDAGHRNYKDDSHKPELIFALTRFEGMAGFRHVDATARLLRLLELPWADAIAARLDPSDAGGPDDALRAVATDLLALPTDELGPLLASLRDAALGAERRLHSGGRFARPRSHQPDPVEREATRVFAMLPDLVERYPADAGILVALLLNHIVLAPGESMYVDAGVIHAYTSGLGVEIMASSDNVLRAGLTPKHTDVPELLSITDFSPIDAPLFRRADLGDDTYSRVEPPVDEFTLHVAKAPVFELPDAGPRVLLVLDGSVELVTGVERLPVRKGTSVFVPHAAGKLVVLGTGRVAVGAVPER